MRSKIKGIVIQKRPFQERHVLATLLTESGEKFDIAFYGGSGGGKKQKSSILEVGYMLEVEIQMGAVVKDILTAKEWNLGWQHSKIRYDYAAYSLLCFYLEVIFNLSQKGEASSKFEAIESRDLYVVLSNSLYYLEKSCVEQNLQTQKHLCVFLIKVLQVSGVLPSISECIFSERALSPAYPLILVIEQGGFAIADNEFGLSKESDSSAAKELWISIRDVGASRYDAIDFSQTISKPAILLLYFYSLFQFGWDKNKLKTFNSLGL